MDAETEKRLSHFEAALFNNTFGRVFAAAEGLWAISLLRERDAEVERLKRVVKDYGDQIIERRRLDEASDNASGSPLAWAVSCPRGHEYDYMIFSDAAMQAESFCESEDAEEPSPVIPLYAKPAGEEVERLKEIAKSAQEFRFWFNEDGSFCDGFRSLPIGERLDRLLRNSGYEPRDVYGKLVPAAVEGKPQD